jgi:hypothetical protein
MQAACFMYNFTSDGAVDSNFLLTFTYFSALFTFLVGRHASVISLPSGNVLLAQLACRLNVIILCLHWE